MSSRNEQAVNALKELGYELPRIRQALLKLAGVTEPQLAKISGVTRASIGHQITGIRKNNLRLQAIIAYELDVRPELLFEGWADLQKKTGAVLRPAKKEKSSSCDCVA